MTLSAAELNAMREAIDDLMPDTADVLQVTQVSDGAGGLTDTWGTASGGVAVPCRLDFPSPGKESQSNASYVPFKVGVVSMPYGQLVTTANRLLISGETYDVKGVNNNQSWIGVKRLAVERVP
jgi:hypothetical protein